LTTSQTSSKAFNQLNTKGTHAPLLYEQEARAMPSGNIDR